jgi:hypothetical protein
MASLKSRDLRRFTDILNSITEQEMGKSLSADHWINQPIEVGGLLKGHLEQYHRAGDGEVLARRPLDQPTY